jgi:hypothetical protein
VWNAGARQPIQTRRLGLICVCTFECTGLCMYVCMYVKGAAEIVKHFKILFRCFSARVSRNAGI